MKMFERAKTNRLKALPVSVERLLNFLNWKDLAEYICLETYDLPDGCIVRSFHPDYNVGGFIFIIEHESFDEVPEGVRIPEMTLPMTKTVKLQKAWSDHAVAAPTENGASQQRCPTGE